MAYDLYKGFEVHGGWQMTIHTAKYEHNPSLKLYRCTCTCGWFCIDTEIEECERRFTGHDLWEPMKREPSWKARLREIKEAGNER